MIIRPLTAGEAALARETFGAALNPAPVRLLFHRLRFPFAVALGPLITIPGGPRADLSQESPEVAAWLVHELTHVWQWRTRPLWAVLSWARLALAGGYGPGLPGYRYTLPAHWGELNLEQQAAVMEDRLRLMKGASVRHGPAGATLAAYRGLAPF